MITINWVHSRFIFVTDDEDDDYLPCIKPLCKRLNLLNKPPVPCTFNNGIPCHPQLLYCGPLHYTHCR